MLSRWQIWAGLPALFAALRAVQAKLGVTGIESNLATLLHAALVLLGAMLALSCPRSPVRSVAAEAQAGRITPRALSAVAAGIGAKVTQDPEQRFR